MRVDKLFSDEIKEKRLIARSAHNRVRRGAKGKFSVRLPFELMDRKEKREYTKPGEVRRYQYLLTYPEFYAKTREEQIKILQKICDGQRDIDLARSWGMSVDKFRRIRAGLGIVKDKTGHVVQVIKPDEGFILPKPNVPEMRTSSLVISSQTNSEKKQEVIYGMRLEVNKRNFSGEQVTELLMQVSTLFEKMTSKFNISLKIEENEEGGENEDN